MTDNIPRGKKKSFIHHFLSIVKEIFEVLIISTENLIPSVAIEMTSIDEKQVNKRYPIIH